MAERFCLGRRFGRARNIRAMAQKAAGDADHSNDASVDTTSRGNRKYRPGHRGRVQAITELIERKSGARPGPPGGCAWLQRTNLWRRGTSPRPWVERLRSVGPMEGRIPPPNLPRPLMVGAFLCPREKRVSHICVWRYVRPFVRNNNCSVCNCNRIGGFARDDGLPQHLAVVSLAAEFYFDPLCELAPA